MGWGWVALLTLLFGVQVQTFTSARYIGHQAREILTHGLITLPLTIAVLRRAAEAQAKARSRAPSVAKVSTCV